MSGVKITLNVRGSQRLQVRMTKRANFLGGQVNRAIIGSMGKAALSQLRKTVGTFRPGSVPDLSPGYKKQKIRQFGRAYPILKATGMFLDSMRFVIGRPKRGSGYVISVRFAGMHYGGKSNAQLADLHLATRDFTQLPPGFSDPWKKRIQAALRRLT